MNDEQAALFERVRTFRLDQPGASFPFSKKLGTENHWTRAYTKRVIEEYKRFAFLAVASGHPVSPSEAVDQAWHMHLTYTRNYWKVFCAEVLQSPLHHGPTQGGDAERDKFDDWYRMTLESYRKFFKSEPPSDIWPSPEQRLKSPPQIVRIDQSTYWVIRKPSLSAKGKLGVVAGLSLFIFGCSGAVAESNPFDWRGPDFLRFYCLLFVLCMGTAHYVRYTLRTPITHGPGQGPHLDGYQMAYLNKGKALTVDAAIARLVHQNVIGFVANKPILVKTSVPFTSSNPLEQNLYGIVNQPAGARLRQVRIAGNAYAEQIGIDLKRQGLLVSDDKAAGLIGIPIVIALIAPAIGLIKINIGLSRERPVEYLSLLCVLSVIVTLAVFCRRQQRTRYGDTVLNQLRERFANLSMLGHHQTNVSQDDLLVAVGLFGMAALAGSDMGYLVQYLRPQGAGSSGCSSMSSCGGSAGSCGGGGSDGGGGGGCGGGGCGGCGGG